MLPSQELGGRGGREKVQQSVFSYGSRWADHRGAGPLGRVLGKRNPLRCSHKQRVAARGVPFSA